MAKIRRINESKAAMETKSDATIGDLRSSQPIAGTVRFCAYNRTRERFLSNQVEVGSFSTDFLEQRLATIAPRSSVALWINPFRELPLGLFRFPVDLVHLDQSCVVIDVSESFPISTQQISMGLAASVLALPARTVSTIGIERGDQLILCSSDDMELRLAQLQNEDMELSTGRQIIPNRTEATFARFSMDQNVLDKDGGNALELQEDLNQVPHEETSPAEKTPAASSNPEEIARAQAKDGEPRLTGYVKKKSWWRRFLAGEPPDPRKAERESIPGLVAYFFTGGAPIAHKVGNISANGLYVLTEERWYPDTALRVTLSDERDPSRQVSITLFARVARSGSDGLGMQFGFVRKKDVDQRKASANDDQSLTVTKEQMEDFVRRFKASS
jgi:hypothetical protein